MMRTAIATVSLSGTLEQKLRAIAAAGFDGVEIFENDLIASPLSPYQIRELCLQLGLTVELYQPFRDLDARDGSAFEANLRRLDAKLALAAALGAPGILVCSNVSSTAVNDDRTLVQQLDAAARLAAEHGLVISYEALAWGTHVSTYEHAWRLVTDVDQPALGICLDSFHIFSAGSPLEPIAAIPGDKITFVQLADAPEMKLDPLSWSRHHRLFPGQGSFDLVGFMSAVTSTGFTGPWSIEVFNDVFRQTDPRRTAVDALRSLIWLNGEVSSALASADATVGGELRPGPLPQLQGLDFLELTPDPDGRTEEALAALGFSCVGVHRSKEGVRLWRLGEARIVINPRPLSHDTVFEQRVTALGIRVSDAEQAAQRATALRAEPIARPRLDDEQELHGLKAPDGLEVYFTSPTAADGWPSEFGDAGTAAGTASARIDHFAIAVPWQYFEEALLFFRSTLGLRPEDEVDVAGTQGLVKSRALEATAAGIRLVLNVMPAGMAQAGPRDIVHIAIEYEDIAGAVRRLRRAGVAMVSPPGNYYDDLAARFELPSERMAELRAHGLFYDRDAGGAEYLQAYTGDLGNLFFELIQRDDGYSGYGALNSPTRRAAQAAAVSSHGRIT